MQQSEYANRKSHTAMVLCANPNRTADLANLGEACGFDMLDVTGGIFPDVVDVLLADLRTKSDDVCHSLSKMGRYLEGHRGMALIWTDMEMLDAAYAAFHNEQTHFLVDADDIEAVPILARFFSPRQMSQVHDKGRDLQFGALHKMSDELAGFARTLARIAEQDLAGSVVTDKPVSFRPAPAGSFQPFPSTTPGAEIQLTATAVRDMIKLRRLRDSYFAADLFADPAWDILLDLMAARLEDRAVSVSSLCIAAAVPPTTALRWITAMTESGILIRQNDPSDARRVFIILSNDAEAGLRQYLTSIQERSAAVV